MLPRHAHVIFAYATKHNYQDILSKAAPLVIDRPLHEIAAGLPPHLIVPWVRLTSPFCDISSTSEKKKPPDVSQIEYHEKWNTVARTALSFHTRLKVSTKSLTPRHGSSLPSRSCEECNRTVDLETMKIMCKLGEGAKCLKNLDEVFDLTTACCNTRKEDLRLWRASVEEGIKGIPSFITLIVKPNV